ncbi:MAG: YceI family protein [Hyphomonadaceae bacterium]
MKKLLLAAACAGALAACSPPAPTQSVAPSAAGPIQPVTTEAPAGAYTLDKAHASLIFRVNHLGFSEYTARFTKFGVNLQFDPANPAAMRVEAKIDPRSLALENPPPGFLDQLRGPNWLDTAKHPEMTFRSTAVELVAPNAARVTGDFTLRGVTKPVVLDVTFNGGYAGHPMDPHARIGFSAKGVFKRSDFGMAYGVPAPGSTMGVGDDVNVAIEAEMNGPPLAKPASTSP